VGWTSDSHLAELYRRAQALIFPGEEDFGIVPVEAMASGCPVIAYGRGGTLETVGLGAGEDERARIIAGGVSRVPGGVLFGTQSLGGVMDAIRVFEELPVDRDELPALARPFAVERFDREFDAAFERHWRAWHDGNPVST
jgi:glycosyltransferase involved in cell wall biosynthesis